MPETNHCPHCGTELPAGVGPDQCPKCLLRVGLGSQPAGSSAQPPTPTELAQYFPQLEIIELLGQGGMGIVYKARQKRLDRLVALKILPADTVRDPAFAERFSREARTLARLSHPHIVAVYDFGESDGIYYLLMEYVDGLNLRQLQQAGSLTPREALQIVPSLCDALQYAHNLGVVHRDIKPENVLIDQQGRVKVADFGLAKILGQVPCEPHLTREEQIMGTMNYMAPEQMERPLEVDHRADIYSLGVVFYEMLTGELPIGRFVPPSQKVSVDVRLDEVVLRALEKERERRYQQASEVKTDLENIASQAAPPPAAPVPSSWMQAHAEVKGPAIGLIVVGILNWLMAPVILWIGLYFAAVPNGALSPLIITLVVLVIASTFILFAGLKMKALEARWAALTGSVVAMLATPVSLIGLPVGIWSLVTLSRKHVWQAFTQGRPAMPLPVPTGPRRSWLAVTAASVLAVLALVVLLALSGVTVGLLLPALSARHNPAPKVEEAPRTALMRRILAELHDDYNLASFELTMADSRDSGVFSFLGMESGSSQQFQGYLDLRRLTNGVWEVQGRKPVEHIRFITRADQ